MTVYFGRHYGPAIRMSTCCTLKYLMFSYMALYLTLFDAYAHKCFTKYLVNGSWWGRSYTKGSPLLL